MGTSQSKAESSLAVAAVTEITQCETVGVDFDLDQLRVFHQALGVKYHCDHNIDSHDSRDSTLTEADNANETEEPCEPNLLLQTFNEAMDKAKFLASDRAIFERLFTLMDKTGDDMIHAQEFLVGVSVLLKGDLDTKLEAAFSFLNDSNSFITQGQLLFVILTMTTVASYFGDPVLKKCDARQIMDDVFAQTSRDDGENKIALSKIVAAVCEHPLVQSYIQICS